MNVTVPITALGRAYVEAKLKVLASGYAEEILWQRTVGDEELTETRLLREHAWVVLASGMREAVVRKKFPAVSRSFLDWESARAICEHRECCILDALLSFRNPAKIGAIAKAAALISARQFDVVRAEIAANPVTALGQLPFMGPATVRHLAKNLGFCLAKPDRHLSRLAQATGYGDASTLCGVISDYVGDPVPVVDVVLWRFATLSVEYLSCFVGGR